MHFVATFVFLMQKHAVIFRDLGQMDYQQAWDLQEKTLRANLDIKSKAMEQQVPAETVDHLFFVEHPAVYTLGKSGNKENVLLGEEELKEKQIQFFHTNRGGDITFHGAGQIVGYPILDLERYGTDIGKYLRNIEQVIINLLAEYGLKGDRSKGETGVWLDPDIPGRERKICAIGVRCSRWITMHGFALNVNTDLTYFEHIIPCGIVGKQVTSLQKELGHEINMEEVKDKLRLHFEQIFQVEFRSEILL